MVILSYIALGIVLAAVITIVVGRHSRKTFAYRYSLMILIGAVFAGLVLIYYPFAYQKFTEVYGKTGFHLFIVSAAQSIQTAFRTFVLDGEWADFLDNELEIPIQATIIGLGLNVMAPVLTFSAILSLFNEIRAKYRTFRMARGSNDLIVMAELNKDSIFLAEDIIRTNKKARIIFTDVYPEEDESNYELKEKAKKINAVFLRSDVSELVVPKRNALTDFFLIGHDEEENVMQAQKLFEKYKDQKKTRIFVRAVHEGNSIILNSMAATLEIEQHDKDDKTKNIPYEEMKDAIRNGGILKLRRFDPEQEVAWREIPKMNFIREAFSSAKEKDDKTLSILVIADTHLAYMLVKTLLWYCQSDKFDLVMNIVYTDQSKLQSVENESESWPADIRYLLNMQCPDIISTNKVRKEDDAYYDIEFFEKDDFVKCYFHYLYGQGSQGSEQIDNQASAYELSEKEKQTYEKWKRISQTDAVFIDSQKDIDTIETAIKVRTAFACAKVMPEIYAVCTDDEDILSKANSNYSLTTHKAAPYDIRFIGKRSDIYTYENILNADNEELGFCQHIKWAHVNNGLGDYSGDLISYEKREYNRLSSLSKALYLRNVIADPEKELEREAAIDLIRKKDEKDKDPKIYEDVLFEKRLVFRDEYECEKFPSNPEKRWHCDCAKCRLRRIIEHNRWNAYMRTIGYVSENTPNSAASDGVNVDSSIPKIHGDLVPFHELDEIEQMKDS